MDSKEFKKLFDEIACKYAFEKAYSGWFKSSNECIAVLELQKSSFGNNYYLNIKVFIQGVFNKQYVPNKDLIKSAVGHIMEQIRDKDFLDLDVTISNDIRKQKLELFFQETVTPFIEKTLQKESIMNLYEEGKLSLLPSIKKELNITN